MKCFYDQFYLLVYYSGSFDPEYAVFDGVSMTTNTVWNAPMQAPNTTCVISYNVDGSFYRQIAVNPTVTFQAGNFFLLTSLHFIIFLIYLKMLVGDN
jgi:hypothetical protein